MTHARTRQKRRNARAQFETTKTPGHLPLPLKLAAHVSPHETPARVICDACGEPFGVSADKLREDEELNDVKCPHCGKLLIIQLVTYTVSMVQD